MLIEIPVVYHYDDDSTENDEIDIAPQHIVTIRRDPDNAAFCIIVDRAGDEWHVRLSRRQMNVKIKAFMQSNIMSTYYNELRSNGS